jgi:phosphomannomutase
MGLIKRFNPTIDYYEHVRTLIDFDIIAENPQLIVVDSMFGSGRGLIKGVLQGTGCEVFEVRAEMNPGFGGIHPEPIGRNLGPLAGAIMAGHGQIGIGTDGDGDRLGAMDGRGQFVDPHRVLALGAKYLVEQRGWKGKIVKTVSTTHMLNRVADKYDLELVETPVGFNHIADLMLNNNVLIGGEESGGISIQGHIPEGDGILTGLLLVEMVAATGKPLEQLVSELLEEFGPSHYARDDLRLARPISKPRMVETLRDSAPDSIGGVAVESVNDVDGVKYVLADESWLLIRPSGTEPVLRVYAEAREPDMLQVMLEHGRSVAQGTA